MMDYQGKRWNEPRGPETLGENPFYRLYRTTDQWIFLAGDKTVRKKLATISKFKNIIELEPLESEQLLESELIKMEAEAVSTMFCEADISCQICLSRREVINDPIARERNLVIAREHKDTILLGMPIGTVRLRTNGPSPWLSRSPVVPGRSAPVPHSDYEDVMAELKVIS